MRAHAGLLAGCFALAGQATPPPGLVPTPLSDNRALAAADEHYERREQARVGTVGSPLEIGLAISAYEAASESPDSAQARWKLARALYFRGRYTGLGGPERTAVFERARSISEAAIAILARRARGRYTGGFEGLAAAAAAAALASDPDAAPTFFWAAVSWGEWALARGKLAAARAGAAGRIRKYCQVLIAIDPEFEEGGGYRILGRLHDQAPRIPFLTGWVSPSEALGNLREAARIAPRNMVNRHFLAEALARGSAGQRQEAMQIERGVVADAPSPGHLVEELAIQEQARRNLEAWK